MVFSFARNAWYRSDLYNRSLRRRPPAQINQLTTSPLPGDPARGAALVDGTFHLAARKRPLGRHPFDAVPPGRRAAAELHAFGWLADLAALSGGDARALAADLARDWLARCDRWDALAWAPGVTAARLLAWMDHIDFMTKDDTSGLRATLAASAAAQARHLAKTPVSRGPDDTAAAVGAALATAAQAMPDLAALADTSLSHLETAAGAILPDGGHGARSPALLAAILCRLVAARRALAAGRHEVPASLTSAIQRIVPALKGTTLGDGGLADFNGGWAMPAARLGALVQATGVKVSPASSMPDWGFERLHAGTTVVVADAGGASGGYAGALSFEMSAGRHRLVVNCGAHPDETTEWSKVLRATAAHSTLSVNDTDALPAAPDARAGIGLAARRNEREGSSLVQLSHGGYRPGFGIVHNRDLYLSSAGDDFRGKDWLVGGTGAFTIRFHLHPDVQASELGGGGAVLLKLPGGNGWRFRSAGADLGLEESVYLGDPERPRRSRQIVLRGAAAGGETEVRWSFLREGA